ncbi:MAG: disulfide bond formation protein B [Xanthomonadales bacterium]|nr:disulfide bond formation protein B [Xanthomonadales bacterium]
MTPRIWHFFAFLCCVLLVSFAMYNQYMVYLSPCPLCVLQRVAFISMGVVALLAFIHNPGRTGQLVYAWMFTLGAVFGALVAGRHVWLQNLPPELVPECSPGLNYMLENWPVAEVVKTVLYGSGDCAEVLWTFLGMSMPMWTFVWFVGLSLVTLRVVYRRTARG